MCLARYLKKRHQFVIIFSSSLSIFFVFLSSSLSLSPSFSRALSSSFFEINQFSRLLIIIIIIIFFFFSIDHRNRFTFSIDAMHTTRQSNSSRDARSFAFFRCVSPSLVLSLSINLSSNLSQESRREEKGEENLHRICLIRHSRFHISKPFSSRAALY